MRKKYVIGNWKMNMNHASSLSFIENIDFTGFQENVNAGICAPFPYILACNKALISAKKTNSLFVGAQDCSAHLSGAYTGEVSANMLVDIGASHVIIGHSERRAYHGENNASLLSKLNRSQEAGLDVIFCVGETLDQRKSGLLKETLFGQLEVLASLNSTEDWTKIILAYEPVWAIGTGETATPEQAQEVHGMLREKIKAMSSAEVSGNISILYGGSVKPTNAKQLFQKPDIDGALVGGASLKPKDFTAICSSF